MKNLKLLLLFSIIATIFQVHAKDTPKAPKAKSTQALGKVLKIALEEKLMGRNKINLLVVDESIATLLQENFGTAKDKTILDIHTGETEKESLDAYKGLDEQMQRQTLCAEINEIINLLVASAEAITVSKLDSKIQEKILALKHLQEQVALNWADKQLFTKDEKKISLKEIQDAIRTELPVLISISSVKEYFCSEALKFKASDCTRK